MFYRFLVLLVFLIRGRLRLFEVFRVVVGFFLCFEDCRVLNCLFV